MIDGENRRQSPTFRGRVDGTLKRALLLRVDLVLAVDGFVDAGRLLGRLEEAVFLVCTPLLCRFVGGSLLRPRRGATVPEA